jgi:hypothetical protein
MSGTTPRRRSGRPSAIASLGLTGAPGAPAQVGATTTPPAPAEAPQPVHDVTTSRPHDVTPQPAAVAYTVRLSPEEAHDSDALLLDLRRAVGRRLDKSATVRALLRLARTDPAVRAALLAELRRTGPATS